MARMVCFNDIMKNEQRVISSEALRLIRDVSLRPRSGESFARDVFMLSFCLMGVSASELYRMQPEIVGALDVPQIAKPLCKKYADRIKRRAFCFYHRFKDERSFSGALSRGMDKLKNEIVNAYRHKHMGENLTAYEIEARLRLHSFSMWSALKTLESVARECLEPWENLNEGEANEKIMKYVF